MSGFLFSRYESLAISSSKEKQPYELYKVVFSHIKKIVVFRDRAVTM
jgi:hypothetical protein